MRISDWSSDVCSSDLEAAISPSAGELVLYDIADTGMSTGRRDIAERHTLSGFDSEQIRVKTTTLEEVLGMAKDKEVHWLKIDVEGMEACVLESWGASNVRPWVVVIECVDPNSKESNFDQWESRSEEHTSELQSLMRISYAVFCLKKKKTN